jgi:dipeptidyl aminopeptidase/acylaminoacyl peptidase
MNGTFRLAAAAVATFVVAAVALAVYFSQPALGPAGSSATPPASAATSPTQAPTTTQPAVVQPTNPSTKTPDVTVQPTETSAADGAPWVLFHWNLDSPGPRGSSELWAMRADGSGAHKIDTPPGGISEMAWSKDGRRLLVASSYRVYVAEVDDEIGPLVDTGLETAGDVACVEKSREPFPCQDAAFDWAPDGERVVFVQRCTYELPGCYFLTILNLVNGERTEIYQSPTNRGGLSIELPAWSPDGSQIAFGMARANTVHTDLWVINADGTGLRQIDLGDDIAFVQGPRWSPDGSRIAFTSHSDTELMVYAINSDPANMGGAAISSFTVGDRVCCPEWINNEQLRVQSFDDIGLGSFEFFIADDHSGAFAHLLNLDDALAAIQPPGQVTMVGVPGDPGRIFLWQPAPLWPPAI